MYSQADWGEIAELSQGKLRDRIFSIMQNVAINIHHRDIDDPELLSVVPRLAKLIETKPELKDFQEMFNALARVLGLWNYIDKDTADSRESLLAETASIPALDGITLHREQMLALNTLLQGKNLILSAPTSFGKSTLIDALLATGKYHRVAIVVPTIALLDEFRRRILRRFGGKFQIIMYSSEKAAKGNVIFLGTQERLINRSDLGRLDLAIVDEFYKLDPNRQDDRSLTLNTAVYQMLKRSKQFFFLGPNIDALRFSSDNRWKFEFLKTRFSTVAVDTYDLRGISNKVDRLKQELQNPENWPALLFVSAPDRVNTLATELADTFALGRGKGFANWIDLNFGQDWDLARVVRNGIGVHHGRIPRAVAAQFVRMFNVGSLPILICTSTLIEGVNTAAKSVFIYDKAIKRENFDFFTFSNIRGRAGRLGQHHVGSVYLFHSPPNPEDTEIDAPLFGDIDSAPDELIVHLSEQDGSPVVNSRVEILSQTLGLTPDELKLASSIGLEDAGRIKEYVRKASRGRALIHWSGYAKYEEILDVCKIICEIRRPREFGVVSDKQLAFFLNNLRSSRTMGKFFIDYTRRYTGPSVAQDSIFRFLRSCEYGLPQLFSVIELFAKRLNPSTNYGLFIAEMPRWFRPEVLKQLDEQGVPVQISERFYRDGDDISTLSKRLIAMAKSENSQMSKFECMWVEEALPSIGYELD